jgi:hypothetical protein
MRSQYQWQQDQIDLLTRRQQNANRAISRQAGELRTASCALSYGTVDAVLILGSSRDVPIVWATPFRTAAYRVEMVPAAGVLGRATMNVVEGSQTVAGLTVRVTATLALAAGAQFLVHGVC